MKLLFNRNRFTVRAVSTDEKDNHIDRDSEMRINELFSKKIENGELRGFTLTVDDANRALKNFRNDDPTQEITRKEVLVGIGFPPMPNLIIRKAGFFKRLKGIGAYIEVPAKDAATTHHLWVTASIAQYTGQKITDFDIESVRSALIAASAGVSGQFAVCNNRGARKAELISRQDSVGMYLLPDERTFVFQCSRDVDVDHPKWLSNTRRFLISELADFGADSGWVIELFPKTIEATRNFATGTLQIFAPIPNTFRRLVAVMAVPCDSKNGSAKGEWELPEGLKISPTTDKVKLVAEYTASDSGTRHNHPISVKVLEQFVKQDKIIAEINQSNVMRLNQAMAKNKSCNVVIAAGKQPINGTEEIIVPPDYDPNAEGQLNRGRFMRFVNSNEKFARVVRLTEPQNGIDLYGEVIEAKTPENKELKLTENIHRDDEGFLITSGAGRVNFDQQSASLEEVFEVKGDIDLKVGDQIFDEPTIVHGSIEGVSIIARNDLTVTGTVRRATIICAGTLEIHGGVIGDSYVRTKGELKTAFAESSRLYAVGEITIQRAAINCRVCTDETITNVDENGGLFGGVSIAQNGANLGSLGKNSSALTTLIIGAPFREYLRSQMISDRIAALQKARRVLGKEKSSGKKPDSKRIQSLKKNADEKREKIGQLLEVLQQKKEEIYVKLTTPPPEVVVTIRKNFGDEGIIQLGDHEMKPSQGGVASVTVSSQNGGSLRMRSLNEDKSAESKETEQPKGDS